MLSIERMEEKKSCPEKPTHLHKTKVKLICVWAPLHLIDLFMLHALASLFCMHVSSKLQRPPFYSLLFLIKKKVLPCWIVPLIEWKYLIWRQGKSKTTTSSLITNALCRKGKHLQTKCTLCVQALQSSDIRLDTKGSKGASGTT